eukprot:SAG11_NODE_7079_length_1197_cov_4.087432_2_plen_144_part_00
MDDVGKTMVDRNKKRKDPTISAADLPVWNKKQKVEKQDAVLSEEEQLIQLVEKVKQSILGKLTEREKDIDFALKVFDKDKDGAIIQAEFVGVITRSFGISTTDGKAAFAEIPKATDGKLTHQEFKDWLEPADDFASQADDFDD